MIDISLTSYFKEDPKTGLLVFDKEKMSKDSVLDCLNRTLTMFRYRNLPETITERDYELISQVNGNGVVAEHKDELLALQGGYMPPYDANYNAKFFKVVNPWADIDRNYEIYKDKEAVLFRNDPLDRGLLPIFSKYGAMMTESQITFVRALINFRAMFVFTGDEDMDKQAADIFMKKIEKGESGSVVTSESAAKNVEAQPLLGNASNYITQSIESQQYILGMLYQQIGIKSTFNMKRERQTANESQLDDDPLRPLIDAMLEEREKAWDRINKRFGTDVSVEFNGLWEKYNKNILTSGDGVIPEDTEDGSADVQPEELGPETESLEGNEVENEEVAEAETVTEAEPEADPVEAVKEVIEEVIEKAAEEIDESLFKTEDDDDENKEHDA